MSLEPEEAEVTPEDVARALTCPKEYLLEGAPFLDHDPTLFRTWALGPVFMSGDGEHTRQHEEGGDLFFHLRRFPALYREWQGVRVERHGKWWDHLSYRVLDEEDRPARVFRVIVAWYRRRQAGESREIS